MNSKIIEVGSRIDSYCTKCRLWLEHTIVAMVRGEIKKVECRTCVGTHQYRSHPPGITEKTSKVTRLSSHPVNQKKNVDKDWEEFMAKVAYVSPRPYQMKETYKVGEIVNHTTFGLCMVTSIEGPYKIKVLFEKGSKVLACNRKS